MYGRKNAKDFYRANLTTSRVSSNLYIPPSWHIVVSQYIFVKRNQGPGVRKRAILLLITHSRSLIIFVLPTWPRKYM